MLYLYFFPSHCQLSVAGVEEPVGTVGADVETTKPSEVLASDTVEQPAVSTEANEAVEGENTENPKAASSPVQPETMAEKPETEQAGDLEARAQVETIAEVAEEEGSKPLEEITEGEEDDSQSEIRMIADKVVKGTGDASGRG